MAGRYFHQKGKEMRRYEDKRKDRTIFDRYIWIDTACVSVY